MTTLSHALTIVAHQLGSGAAPVAPEAAGIIRDVAHRFARDESCMRILAADLAARARAMLPGHVVTTADHRDMLDIAMAIMTRHEAEALPDTPHIPPVPQRAAVVSLSEARKRMMRLDGWRPL